MIKKILYIFIFAVVVFVMFFGFEQGASYFVNRNSKTYELIEISYSNYAWTKEYYGVVIYNDGSIHEFKDSLENIVSSKWYRIMYSDLVKLKKYINDLDGEFEIDRTIGSDMNSNSIYVYRRGEKLKIFERGYVEGQNNSDLSKKIRKILKKYNYSID